MANKRIALVSGGNRGIGLEVCRQLATAGLHVILGSRNRSTGDAAAKALADSGVHVESHLLDVSDEKSIRTLANDLTSHVDVLVNNAGLLLDEDRDVLEIDVQSYRDSMETNVYGPLLLAQAFMPAMLDRGYGRVVNVSSSAGQLSSMGDYAPPYSLSKAALNALTRQLASAARGRDVLVNSVDPGWVRTDMGGRGSPALGAERRGDNRVVRETAAGGPSGRFFRDRKEIDW